VIFEIYLYVPGPGLG